MATMTDAQAHADTLNSLLRGELAAVETYTQAEKKFAGKPEATELARIRADHQHAVNELRQHVTRLGGQPETSSGMWGTFAKLWEGGAQAFGENAAMGALKQGEQQGISDYESTLKNHNMPAECQALITALLPRCREHLTTLDRLMQSNK